jgi:hypothetical protein
VFWSGISPAADWLQGDIASIFTDHRKYDWCGSSFAAEMGGSSVILLQAQSALI